jgi:hypothetical protein
MPVTFNEQQLALGRAMGFGVVSSQRDLDQINAFARANGVNNLSSQNDLNALLPRLQTPYETSPGSNQWVNPNDLTANRGTYAGAATSTTGGGLPQVAADGSSSASDLSSLLMQQQASLKAQNDAFMQSQQAFAQQQAAQQAQMQQQLLLARNSANAATPGSVAGATGQATTGWNSNTAGRSSLESLLLGTQAVTGAMQMVVA